MTKKQELLRVQFECWPTSTIVSDNAILHLVQHRMTPQYRKYLQQYFDMEHVCYYIDTGRSFYIGIRIGTEPEDYVSLPESSVLYIKAEE